MSTNHTPTACHPPRIADTCIATQFVLVLVLILVAVSAPAIANTNTDNAIPASENPELTWIESTVKRGDTLSGIADGHHISPQELHAIMRSGEPAKRLSRIKPGDKIQFGFDSDDKIQQITTRLDEETRLLIERNESGFVANTISEPLERRIQFATGTIENSLFGAAREAGISQPVIMQLAGLFGWDVDFSLDVRSGDQFSVVFETLYRDGEHVRDSHIIAAEYINRDQSFRAVRYTNPDGESEYYAPDGQSLRKAFLRSPIEFARVTSGFNLKRKHPVLHTIRAHKGVDYAAKTGTPIRSTGDGKIIFRGRKGGYGRTVIIKHGARYSTLYAHMSNYARKQKVGTRIKQGQVIGYVGRSGLATGAHLHYEFLADGVHRNPLRFKFPGVAPVPEQLQADFFEKSAPLFAQLDLLIRRKLALNE